MRIDTDMKFWVVADPIGGGTVDDILFETDLRELERQFRGGLTCDTQPVIFTDEKEARAYAEKRLEAWRRHREVAREIETRLTEERERYRAEIAGAP